MMKPGTGKGLLFIAATALGGCAGKQALTPRQPESQMPQARASDSPCSTNAVASVFAGDANTRVRLVKTFTKGEPITLDGQADAPSAPNDLCVVKLMVGPGNPGPAGAPSTSEGIGIEVWLPSAENWNGRIHNLGSGGMDGVIEISSLTKLGAFAPLYSGGPAKIAAMGSASAINDSGHVAEMGAAYLNTSFLMNPDGKINETLAKDFAGRAGHEMAVRTKLLAQSFYGKSADHSYLAGCSNGGRQAMKAAQDYPEDYDGILANAPAISLTSMATTGLYPGVVFQQDLAGKPVTPEQLNFVSAAAVSACDKDATGRHSGYISNPAMCRYNPVKDPKVLCASEGGKNKTAHCVTRRQAKAINKIWYGPTEDGSVPDPAVANGYSTTLGKKQIWNGISRGTQLAGLAWTVASSKDGKLQPFSIPTQFAALILGDPGLATPEFQNATGNGADGWIKLTYADLARIKARGLALQDKFGHLNADNPDLSAFKARGGKLLSYHGMADQTIPIQGTDRYYEAVAQKMGGVDSIKSFYRYYQVPAYGHCFGVGQVDGLPGVSPKADPPLAGPNQFFEQLVAWVEQDKAPEEVVLHSASGTSSRPVCTYPKQVRYKGGDPKSASSYSCELMK